ncbi:MAG: hypothetical protein HY287_02660 [Planctomycetes bacterium]|nr:hypothetical protein [Planctomycetota bacterium]
MNFCVRVVCIDSEQVLWGGSIGVEGTKEVYVVWRSREEPSPFIMETASGIFASVQELYESQ